MGINGGGISEGEGGEGGSMMGGLTKRGRREM